MGNIRLLTTVTYLKAKNTGVTGAGGQAYTTNERKTLLMKTSWKNGNNSASKAGEEGETRGEVVKGSGVAWVAGSRFIRRFIIL